MKLLRGVRQGDPAAVSQMIEGHLRLANGLVSRYMSSKSADADDLVSAAFFAVTYAVNRIAAGHMDHDNVGGYITKFLHKYLHAALNGRPVIGSPCDSPHHIMCHQLRSEHDCGVEPDTHLEVEEEIESLADDPIDVKIIRMLQLGYKGTDIARDLCIHKGTVSRRINRIRSTYTELSNE
jgi:DNA-directed RNA polymerase specialized sigma24 family protein